MRIALLYSHHRKCGPYWHKCAFQALGHEVLSVGPWNEAEPWGSRGREPDIELRMRAPAYYEWDELSLPWTPDLFVLCEGGENLRVLNVPVPWAHFSTEGVNLDWSNAPHKFAEIMCNGADPETVEWLPKACWPTSVREQFRFVGGVAFQPECLPREYDIVQLASARESRVHVWQEVQRRAPDLSTLFGDIWGPVYDVAYVTSLATYVCSSIDFVTTRVFEAMGAGCVVISDRTPSIAKLFTEGEHFIGYDPVSGPGGEGMPDVDWLIDTVRNLRRNGDGGMGERAKRLVRERHTYIHRAQRILEAVFG